MKKSIKITESQYNRIFLNEVVLKHPESLLNEQKPDYLMPGQPDRPGTDMYKAIRKQSQESLKSLGNLIYDVFDCSKLKPKEEEDKDSDWWDKVKKGVSGWLEYGHCIVDNI